MAYDIRPLSFAEILDRSFRVLLDNFYVLISIAAVIWVPWGVLTSLAAAYPIIIGLLVLLLMVWVGPLFQAALAIAIAEVYLERPITLTKAYRSARAILLPFFGTYLLFYAPFGGALLLFFMLPVARGIGSSAMLLLVLADFVGAFLISYLAIRWSLLGPVMVVERRFGGSALSKSSALVAGVWWRTAGVTIAAFLIAAVPIGILNLIWSSIPVLGVLLTGLARSITNTYSMIVIVVYYFDRRCRVEDFDLHHLAEQIRSESAPGNPVAAGVSPIV
ncbi:MAG TPA: hypothetical protein VJX23_17145 [Candidatus Binataceae bacterium]|nr:hypothetical protein [Candidatus Binataceae bacterium]